MAQRSRYADTKSFDADPRGELEVDRVPACVSTCPAGARHYGDLGDPNSDVSKLVAARDGYDLMPELGYKPTNKYLPPRPRTDTDPKNAPDAIAAPLPENRLLHWVDRVLSR